MVFVSGFGCGACTGAGIQGAESRKVERISLQCVCSENFVIRSRFKILCQLQWEPRSCLRYRLLGGLSLRRGREESGTRVQAVS